MLTQNITIIGLHRTGASIALALRASPPDFTLIGHDINPAVSQKALEMGAVDKVESNLIRAASIADILVLAIPSVQLEDTLQAIGEDLQEHTLVIDLTALKESGLNFAERYMKKGHYIGARPIFAAGTFSDGLAGTEKARADLFSNSVFCLMPSARLDPQAVDTAVTFGKLLGASAYFVDPLEYDSLAQGVEFIPGLMAASIFASINKTTGWRDILRFADLPFATATMALETDPDELAYLALKDKQATLRWIDALLAEINDLRHLINDGNEEVLVSVLDQLTVSRIRWLQERRKNEWVEAKDLEIELPGMRQRFLGGLANIGGNR